jgi:hypothetical protein
MRFMASIVIMLRLDDPRFESRQGQKAFPKRQDCLWVPPILFTPPSNAEVENEWSYTSIHLYAFIVCTGTILSFLPPELTFHDTDST